MFWPSSKQHTSSSTRKHTHQKHHTHQSHTHSSIHSTQVGTCTLVYNYRQSCSHSTLHPHHITSHHITSHHCCRSCLANTHTHTHTPVAHVDNVRQPYPPQNSPSSHTDTQVPFTDVYSPASSHTSYGINRHPKHTTSSSVTLTRHTVATWHTGISNPHTPRHTR
jgi:hypothetical protein